MRSKRFVWLAADVVTAIHERQIAEHRGLAGIRDSALLESALLRPENAAAYGERDIAVLAALYALGIVQNHPFVDGNKRVGLVVLDVFLRINGRQLVATDEACYRTIVAIAAGDMPDDAFIAWVRENSRIFKEKK